MTTIKIPKKGFSSVPTEPETPADFVKSAKVHSGETEKAPKIRKKKGQSWETQVSIRLSEYELGAAQFLTENDELERSMQKILRDFWRKHIVAEAMKKGYAGEED